MRNPLNTPMTDKERERMQEGIVEGLKHELSRLRAEVEELKIENKKRRADLIQQDELIKKWSDAYHSRPTFDRKKVRELIEECYLNDEDQKPWLELKRELGIE